MSHQALKHSHNTTKECASAAVLETSLCSSLSQVSQNHIKSVYVSQLQKNIQYTQPRLTRSHVILDCKSTALVFFFLFFLKIFCRTHVLFAGPLIPLFWTSGDVCPGFQSQGGFPHLRASLPARNGFLRFTSGATSAFSTNSGVHCISMYTAWLAWLPSHASGFEPPTQWWAAQQCVTKSLVVGDW